MKLRYYLRGIGIGIVVASAVCICASLNKTSMTDEQIKAKAKELGMTEETVLLAEVAESNVIEVTEEETISVEAQTETVTETATETEEETTEVVTETVEESAHVEETVEDVPADNATNDSKIEKVDEYIVFTVEKGNGSDTVARNLASAGLVSDGATYDKYLCQNGYDRKICAGTHEIPKGATEEEIAKIICNMK